jgi:hypothetical protein
MRKLTQKFIKITLKWSTRPKIIFFVENIKNIGNIPIDPKMVEGRLIVIRNRKSIF